MDLLNTWLDGLHPFQKVLDLGSGAGSFDYESSACLVIAVDLDFRQVFPSGRIIGVAADSHSLPFGSSTFDLIICHHSLEHFEKLLPALQEIRRVLKSDGKLFVSVPDGNSFSDRLYRLLLAGGGHVNQFTFNGVISLIERETLLHLVAWKTLHTSFIYVDRSNFIAAPLGRLPGPLPRRMRWLGRLPEWSFNAVRLFLTIGSRFLDRCTGLKLSLYGWAFTFDSRLASPAQERSFTNVCMHCGFAAGRSELVPIGFLSYRCRRCQRLNPLFGRT